MAGYAGSKACPTVVVRLRPLTPQGAILMYDITNRNTFNSVAGWMDSVSEHASPNITMILVGHKSDLDDEREVQTQEGQKVWSKSPWALITLIHLRHILFI